MVDLFLAIDQFDKKKRLLSGFVQTTSKVSAVQNSSSNYVESSSDDSEEERIASYKEEWKGKKRWVKREPERKTEGEKPKKDTEKPASKPEGDANPTVNKLEEMMKEMKGMMEQRRKPRTDRATVKCFRCQAMGHYASECVAEKPIYRDQREEKPEN